MKLRGVAPCRKEMEVEVPSGAVQAEFDAVYRQLRQVANVPGFRLGHAPQDLLERHHGAKAREQVLQRLVSRSLGEALDAQGSLDLVGQPRVSQVKLDSGGPLTYVAEFEVAPEVPLGPYRGLKLTRPKASVSPEEVERVLGEMRQAHAELRPLLEPRPAAAGDFLLADLTRKQPGQPEKKQREVLIHMNLDQDPEGVLRGLVGMAPGEKRTLPVAEGKGSLTVELKAIKTRDLPPKDDSFARTVGPYETLAALREAVRKDLERQADSLQRQAMESQALEQMGQGWRFEVPPSLVASQARRLLKERAVEWMSKGVAPEQVQDQAQQITDQAKLDALRQVRLFFILRRIAAAEGLAASPEEVTGRIQALAERLHRSPEEIRQDLEKRDLLDELIWGIVREKVIDRVMQEAEIREG